jgi:hypothetical protein
VVRLSICRTSNGKNRWSPLATPVTRWLGTSFGGLDVPLLRLMVISALVVLASWSLAASRSDVAVQPLSLETRAAQARKK